MGWNHHEEFFQEYRFSHYVRGNFGIKQDGEIELVLPHQITYTPASMPVCASRRPTNNTADGWHDEDIMVMPVPMMTDRRDICIYR